MDHLLTNLHHVVTGGHGCVSALPACCQTLVLGPLLFTIYTSLISHITEAHNIQQHQYADDTQLFVALTSSNVHAQVSTLESCLSSLQTWFCANRIGNSVPILNPDKSNSGLFATTQRAQLLPSQVSINISGLSIPLSNHVKILGAVLNPHLTLSEHIKTVSKSCFYHSCTKAYSWLT